ncbi:ATP synthase subunit a domain protein [Streptococcus pneumoniae GA18523]|nr:ATP synthase subunit a domain protein [Streptococcus pneumoniae GA41538]EHD71285.1 ATP synthase subunit a domain protein [Streptococcus pneumoniae GA18523]EHZ35279.1 ATP synthase A chain family protein [Streptococcus pneumoniae GA19101]CAG5955151.1 ATP synthase F0 subunit A [Streptococcus pneumoniae]CIP83359.1 ATP synthase F0 subunit A [Streptococcus pneumoniae]
MNILEEFTNFLSLALRIFGNIFAGEVMTSLLLLLSHQAIYWYPVAFGANLAWTAFSVFISCIQAYVFTLLTSVYLGNKINIEEE